MNTQIWLALIAIAATPLGGWLGAKLMRSKYKVEIKTLRADLEKKLSEVTSNELNNVRAGNDILMQQIVQPLKAEIGGLRRDVSRFRRAVEQIPACPHSAECPVTVELQKPDIQRGERK